MSAHSHSHHGSSNDPRAFPLFGALVSLIGIIGIIASAAFMTSVQQADQALTATGTAMISKVYPPSRPDATCKLDFTYTVDGKPYYGSSGGTARSSTYCGFHAGQEVAVYYNPAHPSDAAIGATRDLDRLGPTILIAVAGLFAASGISRIVIWVRSVFKKRTAAGGEPLGRSARLTVAAEEPNGINSSTPPTEGWEVYPGPDPEAGLLPRDG
jgi:hypothetical protein